jgi:hypothetical protein
MSIRVQMTAGKNATVTSVRDICFKTLHKSRRHHERTERIEAHEKLPHLSLGAIVGGIACLVLASGYLTGIGAGVGVATDLQAGVSSRLKRPATKG